MHLRCAYESRLVDGPKALNSRRDVVGVRHPPPSWLVGCQPARGVAVPGVALLLRLAGREGPLQADGDRRGVGGDPALLHDGGLQPVLRETGEDPVQRASLPDLLLQRAVAVDVLRGRAAERDEHDCGAPAHHHQGLLPTTYPARGRYAVGAGGLQYCLHHSDRHDALLRPGAHGGRPVAPPVSSAGRCDRAGRGIVALGHERHLPGRALHGALSHPVLDVRLARGLSQQPGAGAVAVALRPQPHGRGHRGIPLGPHRPGPAPRPPDARLRRRGAAGLPGGAGLLPEDGGHDCGCGVRIEVA